MGGETKAEHDKEHVNVRLPIELGAREAVKKYEELPQNLKDVTQGISLTRKRYAIRTLKRAEVQVTQHLNPEEARRLGPALGVSMKSKWAIKGIPSYADAGMIFIGPKHGWMDGMGRSPHEAAVAE